jgi:hypothetical protein
MFLEECLGTKGATCEVIGVGGEIMGEDTMSSITGGWEGEMSTTGEGD